MDSPKRQNNFNLFRFTLALLVIFGHSPELIDGDRSREWLTRLFGSISLGEFAVDGFFLLSGYLIAQSWSAQPQPWPFLKKRLLRIYPGFIVASVLCALVVGPLASTPRSYVASFEIGAFVAGLALLSVPAVPDVFAGTHYPLINGSMWTISKEFVCYLFILVAGVTGMMRRRHACLLLTAGVFAALFWLKLNKLHVSHDLRLASFFLSGTCYYLYRERVRFDGRVAAVAAFLTMISLFSWRASELVLASIGGYVFLYAAGKRSPLLSHFNRLPDISYGIYLYGWPVQKLLLWYFPSLSPWGLFTGAAPIAIALGTASWYLVEKPALRFKRASLPALPDPQQEPRAS